MLQDDYRKKYKTIKKNWNGSVSIYRELVRANIKADMTVLEAGCGFNSMFSEEYKKAKRVIGVDVNKEFLKMNEVLNEKVVANLEDLSKIESDSVDLIISSWVLEHIENPDKAFAELSRVLKRGGKFIFLAPNNLNYVIILNRFISESVRNSIVGKMSENLVTDPMPAFYRANSVGRIRKLAMENSLKVERLILNGDPTYVAINKLFFYVGVVIEFFLNLPILNKTRVHLIGVLRKV